ncbi:hypothetical protein TNCV_4812741 [Trichonephila clavipes]|nr:hypothetical protein TNCV_4812741 [Trichonephila clavipes]
MLIFADFCFHFDNWSPLVGARKHASVRASDTQEHEFHKTLTKKRLFVNIGKENYSINLFFKLKILIY